MPHFACLFIPDRNHGGFFIYVKLQVIVLRDHPHRFRHSRISLAAAGISESDTAGHKKSGCDHQCCYLFQYHFPVPPYSLSATSL